LSVSDLRQRFRVSLAGDPQSASTREGPSDISLHHLRLCQASDGSFQRPSRRVLCPSCSDEMLFLDTGIGNGAHPWFESSHTYERRL